jgi:hypothetical protein
LANAAASSASRNCTTDSIGSNWIKSLYFILWVVT